MKLESLPNELLLDLFDFLNIVHIFRAFRGLNSRFDNLLFAQDRVYSCDFRSVSKTEFDIICQEHLPSIADQIVSLRLSDDDETPKQTYCFFSHHLTLGQLIHLQSLSLSDIHSGQIMDIIMAELCDLSHLSRLSVVRCYFRSIHIDNIWRLPKLTHCNLNVSTFIDWSVVPRVMSLSLKNLSILGTIGQQASLKRLLECTPTLRYLSLDSIDSSFGQQLSSPIPSIEILKLSFMGSTNRLENFAQYLPNLCELTVETSCSYANGYQWETMITNHLPKLKRFRLMMQSKFVDGFSIEEQVDQILDSFRTHFWIEEHQWFVRCHWSPQFESKFYRLYTLPYVFTEFIFHANMQFKSTYPENENSHSYDHVRHLNYGFNSIPDCFDIRFTNIQSLILSLPIEDHFWSAIPTFHQLTSLSASGFNDHAAQLQLQTLLDKAPRLYSLRLHSNSFSQVPPVNFRSQSIRRLDLQSNYQCFDARTCDTLSKSPLGIQCEVLWIKVKDRSNILYLVDSMKNLRVLHVRCRDAIGGDKDDFNSAQSTEDQVAKWLLQHLPPTCKIDRQASGAMRLWIR